MALPIWPWPVIFINENDIEGTLKEVDNALKLDPSFWEARKFKGEILLAHGRDEQALDEYRELMEHLTAFHLKTHCSQCGFELSELQWQCPQCRKWDTIQLTDSGPSLPTVSQVPKTMPSRLSESVEVED